MGETVHPHPHKCTTYLLSCTPSRAHTTLAQLEKGFDLGGGGHKLEYVCRLVLPVSCTLFCFVDVWTVAVGAGLEVVHQKGLGEGHWGTSVCEFLLNKIGNVHPVVRLGVPHQTVKWSGKPAEREKGTNVFLKAKVLPTATHSVVTGSESGALACFESRV